MTHPKVKIISSDGKISLGKKFAGKMVCIDQIDDGTWIIKSVKFIPDSEKWLLKPKNLTKLEKALEWANQNKPIDNFDQFAQNIEGKSRCSK